MRKITVLALGLFSCLFIFDRIVGLGLDQLYQACKYGETGGKLNYYLSLEENSDLLIMGSSRAKRHIIPDSFSVKAFNLSHNGMKLPFHVGLLSILEQSNKMPKTLLLQIETNSFVFLEGQDLDITDVQHLRYFYKSNDKIKEYINRISNTEYLKYAFSLYSYNGKLPGLLINFIKTVKNPPNNNGFEPLLPSSNGLTALKKIKKSKKTNKVSTVSLDKSLVISKVAIDYLEDVLEICQRNNTEVIFFTSPKYVLLNSSIKKGQAFLNQYFHEKGILYFDYTQIELEKLKYESYWKDYEHLNLNGAKILTSDIKERITAANG